jgi:hypothetical protein
MSKRARLHRKWIQRQLQDGHHLPAGKTGDGRSLVALSQQQLGNRAVQRLLAQGDGAALLNPQVQRESEQEQDKTESQIKVGQIEIEKPEIEHYDVTGNTLGDVSEQILPDDKWYEYRYEPRYKADKGVINRVDVTVHITVHLPRWVGDGWESASNADKVEWLRLLQSLDIGNEKESTSDTLLPRDWLGVEIDELDDQLRSTWKGMMLEMQAQELSPLSTARRRALVLQQRLYGQPENQFKTIVDRFNKELWVEEEAYAKQMQMGERKKISVGTSALLK